MANVAVAAGFPIDVDLKQNGGVKSFSSAKELERWAEQELTFWKWIPSENTTFQPFRKALNIIESHAQALALKPQPDEPNRIQDMRTALQQLSSSDYLHSTRPEVVFLASLVDTPEAGQAAYLVADGRCIPENKEFKVYDKDLG